MKKKFLIQTYSQARMSGTRLLEVDAVRKELKSKLEARKTAHHAPKRYDRKATYRSGKSRIEKKVCA